MPDVPKRPVKRRRRDRLGRRIRQVFERVAARVAAALIPCLSRRAVVRLSHAAAAVACRVAGRDRRIAEANLRVVFGDALSAVEERRILRAAFQSFALMMLDTFWLGRDTRRRIASVFVMDERMREVLAIRPQICITGHFGNWDLFGVALAAAGMPLSSVAMTQQNVAIDRMLNARRALTGMQVIPRDGALRKLLRELRADRCVALLMDQNTRPEEGGVFLPFCGLPAPVSQVVDVLQRRTGATLCMGFCLPDADGHYHVHGIKAIRPEPTGDDPLAITRLVLTELEAAVRRYPEYWLWAYRRWRFVPDGCSLDDYPYYARRYKPKKERA